MTFGLVYFKNASMFIRATKEGLQNGLQDLKNASPINSVAIILALGPYRKKETHNLIEIKQFF